MNSPSMKEDTPVGDSAAAAAADIEGKPPAKKPAKKGIATSSAATKVRRAPSTSELPKALAASTRALMSFVKEFAVSPSITYTLYDLVEALSKEIVTRKAREKDTQVQATAAKAASVSENAQAGFTEEAVYEKPVFCENSKRPKQPRIIFKSTEFGPVEVEVSEYRSGNVRVTLNTEEDGTVHELSSDDAPGSRADKNAFCVEVTTLNMEALRDLREAGYLGNKGFFRVNRSPGKTGKPTVTATISAPVRG